MTRYVPLPPGAPRIERLHIRSGFAGTRQTAAHVARLIREGASDFYVRQKAIDILLSRGVTPKDYVGEINALFRWVQRNVRYTKDPFHVELLHAARRMLELRAGDCDDMAILLGSLVKSVGHPVRIVLTGPNARRPDLFSHIYLEAQHRGDWIPLDPTMSFAMGWSPRAPVRLVLSIEEESTDDQSTVRRTAITPTTHTTARRALPRFSPRTAARDTHGRSAAARPAGESAVGVAAPPPAPRSERLAQDDSALRVGARIGEKTPAAHHGPDTGPPEGMASARGEAIAPSRQRCGAGDASDAATPTGGAQARGDGATGALSGVIRDASALYQRFKRLPARSIQRVSHQRLMPTVVVELGRLAAVIYRSDKWVGHPRTYIHYMKDPPRLVSDVAGRRLFLIGGSYRITGRGIEG